MGQTHVQRYLPSPSSTMIQTGAIDPSFVITHEAPAGTRPRPMYKTFRDKKDGCIKVVLKP